MAVLRAVFLFADAFSRNPLEAAVSAAAKPKAATGLAGYLLGAFSTAVWLQLAWNESGGVMRTFDMTLVLLVLNVVLGLVYSGMSSLFLEFAGARGGSYSLFVIFGISEGVKGVLIPLSLLLLGAGAGGLGFLAFMAVLVVQFLCAISLIHRVYNVSKFNALLSLAFPGTLAAALAFLSFAVLALWMLAGLKTIII